MVKDFDDLCFHWYDHRVRIQNGWLWILCTLILLIMTGLESFLLENSSKVHALWNIIFINSWGTRTLTTWCRKILIFSFYWNVRLSCFNNSASQCPPVDGEREQTPYICTAPIKVCSWSLDWWHEINSWKYLIGNCLTFLLHYLCFSTNMQNKTIQVIQRLALQLWSFSL